MMIVMIAMIVTMMIVIMAMMLTMITIVMMMTMMIFIFTASPSRRRLPGGQGSIWRAGR